MKRHLTLTIAIMIFVGIFGVSAQAQTASSQTIRARIPFTFTVGDKSLPAGVYTVRILNPTSDRKALQIRSENGRTSAIIQTLGVNSALASNTKLVFRRYGDRYFFAQAQMAGETTSLATTRTRAERATRRALKHSGNGTVAILAEYDLEQQLLWPRLSVGCEAGLRPAGSQNIDLAVHGGAKPRRTSGGRAAPL